jgi:glycine/D-amino acid oxidase-like deaminating enzyme
VGARIEEMTPVIGMQSTSDGYTVATPRGAIHANRILIAAGGWSAEIARLLGAELPIRGAPLQMVVTDSAPPLLPCLIAHADRHLTMKQTDAGTILIGGAWTAATGLTGQPQVLPQSLEGNLWAASHTIPAIGNLSVIRSWAAMNIDIDGAPLIGPLPGLPGVTVAATANGYTLGPLMGREAAHIALTGHARPDLAPFSINRFNQPKERTTP